MKSFRELRVWQASVDLAVEVTNASQSFPHNEQFGLTSQARRAASSVAANIAEGWGRGSRKEYVQFLLIARGSLMELDTHLTVAFRLSYLSAEKSSQFSNSIEEVGKML